MWTRWIPDRLPRLHAQAGAWLAAGLILSACGAWALRGSRDQGETESASSSERRAPTQSWAQGLTAEDLGLNGDSDSDRDREDRRSSKEPRPLPLTAARQALTRAAAEPESEPLPPSLPDRKADAETEGEPDSSVKPAGYHGEPVSDGPPAPTLQMSGLPALSPSPTEAGAGLGSAPPRVIASEPRSLDRGAVSVTGSPPVPSPSTPTPTPAAFEGYEPAPSAAPAPASSPALSPAEMAAGAPKAWAEVRGTASPGLRISLDATASQGGGLRCRWVQTQGEPVELSDPSSPTPSLMVPNNGSALGFLLAVSNGYGMDTYNLTVPIETGGRKLPNSSVKADSGDDQVGVAGRQITLNGIRSEPRGQIGYRWIQIAGAPVSLKLEDGFIYSFVPPRPGLYRFGLVVAKGDEISEPDYVTVNVVPTTDAAIRQTSAAQSVRPASTGPTAVSNRSAVVSSPRSAPRAATAAPRSSAEASTAAALRALDGGAGTAVAEPMAKVFDGIARQLRDGRFRHYDDVLADLSRGLDPVVPREPAVRERWIARLFVPLTAEMVAAMRPEGLDLEQAEGRRAAFSPSQRGKLTGLFQEMARGARSIAPSR